MAEARFGHFGHGIFSDDLRARSDLHGPPSNPGTSDRSRAEGGFSRHHGLPARETMHNSDNLESEDELELEEEVSTRKPSGIRMGVIHPSEIQNIQAGNPTLPFARVVQQPKKVLVQRHLPDYFIALKKKMKVLLKDVLSDGVGLQVLKAMDNMKLKLSNDTDIYTVTCKPKVLFEKQEVEGEEVRVMYPCRELIVQFNLLSLSEELEILKKNNDAPPPVIDIYYHFVGLWEHSVTNFLNNKSPSKFHINGEKDDESPTMSYTVELLQPYL